MKVYVVEHGSTPFSVSINGKMIGIYATKADAEAAKRRASLLPGFRDDLAGFTITEVTLDTDTYPDGFDIKILPPNPSHY